MNASNKLETEVAGTLSTKAIVDSSTSAKNYPKATAAASVPQALHTNRTRTNDEQIITIT